MLEGNRPRLNKLPFWLADGMLLATAATLVSVGGRPLRLWEMVAVTLCVAFGAWLAVLPFLKEYEVAVRAAEADHLSAAVAKLGQLDDVAERIAGASGQWQAVQDRAAQTAQLAQGIVDRLAREAESFAGVVSRTADGEKQTLKLEVEKLRRSEGDWLQSVGRVMDHVFALHVAAVRSGQPALSAQIERFHGACREALRRVGFATVVAAPDDAFDPRKHQTVDGSRAPEGARIDETVAPGFLFQGRLLRPIVVKLTDAAHPPSAPGSAPASDSTADAKPDSTESSGDAFSSTTSPDSSPSPAPGRDTADGSSDEPLNPA